MNKKSCIALVLLVLFVFSSCVTKTKVLFTSDIPGAEVIIDGESMGQTPFTAEVTNAIWEDQEVIVRKNGLKDHTTKLKKEPKIVNILTGILLPVTLYIPLLWCYGPEEKQHFDLGKAN
jgi:hypothetical protein